VSNAGPALVADIGGTNVRFAIVNGDGRPSDIVRLSCADFAGPAEAVTHYLARTAATVDRGAFAIAAPVSGDDVAMTNHPWRFSVEALRQALGFRAFHVVNDFEAIALSLPHLAADDLNSIGGGEAVAEAAKAVLGPGTGLGVSGLIPDGRGGWSAICGEGGHVDLAPGNPREAAVLANLWETQPHVSLERVLSGPGLVNLYTSLCVLDGRLAKAVDLPPSDVVALAAEGNAQAAEAAAMFSGLLGAAAGNLALTLGARGGVYLAGGVTAAMGAQFDKALFRRRFAEKGRFQAYLAPIPTYLITAPDPAFIGLAALLRRGAA
jgi:glucokinase